MQNYFVHRRSMILETHHTGQDPSRCLALWMRTRDLITQAEGPSGGPADHEEIIFRGVIQNPKSE